MKRPHINADDGITMLMGCRCKGRIADACTHWKHGRLLTENIDGGPDVQPQFPTVNFIARRADH